MLGHHPESETARKGCADNGTKDVSVGGRGFRYPRNVRIVLPTNVFCLVFLWLLSWCSLSVYMSVCLCTNVIMIYSCFFQLVGLVLLLCTEVSGGIWCCGGGIVKTWCSVRVYGVSTVDT